jgi:hypothetical protein
MKYVGFDWASQAHDVTVLDEAGQVLDRWAFPHSDVGWLMTLDRLRRQGLPNELPVIVERTSGLVVDRLLSAGHPVVPVHPTAFFATRPRWGASGAKSDPGEATSSPTTCGPTGIGCDDCLRWIPACRSCGR